MSKRRRFQDISEYDINDGSESDDSNDEYTPRPGLERMHNVASESLSTSHDGRILSTLTSIPTPASPSKESQVLLNPDVAPLPEQPHPSAEIPSQNFDEFDAEYGPGIEKGPRLLRDSVRQPLIFSRHFVSLRQSQGQSQ